MLVVIRLVVKDRVFCVDRKARAAVLRSGPFCVIGATHFFGRLSFMLT
jgi:hypothetical protein